MLRGVPSNNRVLNRSIPTLADRLNAIGYRTSFIGKWHLGGEGKPEWQPAVDGGFQYKKYMFNRGHWKKFVLEDGVPTVGARRRGNPSYDVAGADEEDVLDGLAHESRDRVHYGQKTKESVLRSD